MLNNNIGRCVCLQGANCFSHSRKAKTVRISFLFYICRTWSLSFVGCCKCARWWPASRGTGREEDDNACVLLSSCPFHHPFPSCFVVAHLADIFRPLYLWRCKGLVLACFYPKWNTLMNCDTYYGKNALVVIELAAVTLRVTHTRSSWRIYV